MHYLAYEIQSNLAAPMRALARRAVETADGWTMGTLDGWMGGLPAWRAMTAGWALLADTKLSHRRPPFGIDSVPVGRRQVAVREEAALTTPFGTLLRFAKEGAPTANGGEAPQPKVLVVAPLSGHFATLLRGTVRTLLREHDVYITDWHNARDVPLAAGRFGFDEYVEHLMTYLRHLGPNTHVVAVCQPCVQALVAVALMAEARDPAQPASLTLMAGPVDTRINPTEVNHLATERSIDWFERNLIATVPPCHPGAGRKVYPGYMQLMAFMAMNPDRHVKAHGDLFRHLANGDREKAQAVRVFYDEYFAVLDLTAEFYLETVQKVFQEAQLATGELTFRGQKVKPAAIRRTALLTVEGERDDICSMGQTVAAHDLCTGLKPYLKRHHLQADVGHYGVFNGRRWEGQIYPIVRNLILSAE
ncbi:polyhydroxyalkanoate depolymerase [Marinibaculum pumilum]|uniref:Polyhydroxyalkanoate depolymerase n=1 Tax=Marinibaculum pumilum TaxID=1766165 RepID=A0ABV7L1B0_9PROT